MNYTNRNTGGSYYIKTPFKLWGLTVKQLLSVPVTVIGAWLFFVLLFSI